MLGTGITVRFAYLLAVILMLIMLAGCQGDGSDSATPDLSSEREPQGFEVTVWDDSFVDGGQADIEIREIQLGDGVYIELWAEDARNLKALYFDIQFDPALYSLGATDPGLLQNIGDEMLQLAFLDRPGSVQFGQIVAEYPKHEGFTGDGLLARVKFNPDRAGFDRLASIVPTSDRCCVELEWNDTENQLEWGYRNEGDYDQNSETNIADLTPLALHFLKSGPFDPDSIEAVVDGDGNGEINISDMTSIGQNYSAYVSAYNVYFSVDEGDKPQSNTAKSSLEPLMSEDFGNRTGDPTAERLKFACPVDLGDLPQPLPARGYFWIRPSDSELEGTPSTTAEVEMANKLPVAALDVHPPSGVMPLDATLDASGSTDPDGAIVRYEFDLDGDGTFEVDNGTDPMLDHTFPFIGDVTTAVRVTDDDGDSAEATAEVHVLDPGGGIFIRADIGNFPLWEEPPTSGSGSYKDPYIVGGAFEPKLKYGLEANTLPDFTGDPIDPNDLSWFVTPDGAVDWSTPGVFEMAVAGGAQVFASDGITQSNRIYLTIVDNYPPVAYIIAQSRIGTAPFDATMDMGASIDWDGTIVKYEFDMDDDGMFEIDNDKSPVCGYTFDEGMYCLGGRVTDNLGLNSVANTIIVAEGLPVLLGPDMIYAMPSTYYALEGDVVYFTVYTHEAANPFYYMNGVRVVVPEGNFYADFTFNAGEMGGARDDCDGIWEEVGSSFLLIQPDWMITETDLGDGTVGIDFNVTPFGDSSDVLNATGALFSFGLEVHTDIDLTFERMRGVSRTYYSDSFTAEYFWSDDDNSGFPGVDLP